MLFRSNDNNNNNTERQGRSGETHESRGDKQRLAQVHARVALPTAGLCNGSPAQVSSDAATCAPQERARPSGAAENW